MTATRKSPPSRIRVSPGAVFLAVALIGSVAFALYAVTVRDASQIPLLAAGGVALGIVFLALAVYTLRATWRAGIAGRDGRALALGLGGGIAAMIGFGCIAGAIILFLLSQSA
jgi:heme/copper-type cytochrome/quinol oxidase subunit 3